jgi:hypothetical protein
MKAAEGHGGHGSGAMFWARSVGEGLDVATGGSGYVLRATQMARVGSMAAAGGPIGIAAAALVAGAAGYAIYRSMRKGQEDRATEQDDKYRERAIENQSRIERLHRFGDAEQAAGLGIDLEEQNKGIRGQYLTVANEGHKGLMGGMWQWVRNKVGWDVPTRGIPGVDWYKTDTQWKTEDLQRSEKENREMQAKVEEERKYWVEKQIKPGIEASSLRAEGKPAEARKIEKEMALAEERKRLEKLFPHDEASVDKGVDAKRKELEDGGYSTFMKEGGYDAIRASELRTQGKMKEARELEHTVRWWSKYNEVVAKVGDEHADVAIEAANADVMEAKKREAGSFMGAVDARAGAAETVRVATMAAHFAGLPVRDGTKEAIDKLHQSSVTMYRQSSEDNWRKKFPSSWQERVKGGK